jgi:hypothetical protein
MQSNNAGECSSSGAPWANLSRPNSPTMELSRKKTKPNQPPLGGTLKSAPSEAQVDKITGEHEAWQRSLPSLPKIVPSTSLASDSIAGPSKGPQHALLVEAWAQATKETASAASIADSGNPSVPARILTPIEKRRVENRLEMSRHHFAPPFHTSASVPPSIVKDPEGSLRVDTSRAESLQDAELLPTIIKNLQADSSTLKGIAATLESILIDHRQKIPPSLLLELTETLRDISENKAHDATSQELTNRIFLYSLFHLSQQANNSTIQMEEIMDDLERLQNLEEPQKRDPKINQLIVNCLDVLGERLNPDRFESSVLLHRILIQANKLDYKNEVSSEDKSSYIAAAIHDFVNERVRETLHLPESPILESSRRERAAAQAFMAFLERQGIIIPESPRE